MGRQSPSGNPKPGWDGGLTHRHRQGAEGLGGGGKKWDQPLYLPTLPPPHVTSEGGLCGQCSPEGLSPNTCLSPCHPNRAPGAPPATQKGSTKKQQCFFEELQVVTFFTTLSPPHTHRDSSALLLFLPQTRHPATALGGLGGCEGSQQPSCGLRSAR